MSVMWRGLPSITRPAAFYRTTDKQRTWDSTLVEEYIASHALRQSDFEQRLKQFPVRFLVYTPAVDEYIAKTGGNTRFSAAASTVPQQLEYIQDLLEHDNFESRLTAYAPPANAILLGHDLVLIELERLNGPLLAVGNVMGLEIQGAEARARFEEQFEGIWGRLETLKPRRLVVAQLRKLIANASG